MAEIGRIIRIFREKTGRNLSEVAGEAGISVSMLSQIERGVVAPSVDTLLTVCGAMELDMSDLFRRLSPAQPVRVVAPANRLKTGDNGVRYEQLIVSTDRAYPAEMFLLEVQPGRSVGLSGRGHEGVEMGYVLNGRATLTIDNTEFLLSEGESVSFASPLPHRLANSGDAVFRAVWTVMPPHKDYLEPEEKT